jgi:hypothetical protein
MMLGGCACLAGAVMAGVFFLLPKAPRQTVPLLASGRAHAYVEPSDAVKALTVGSRDIASPEAMAAAKKSRVLTEDYLSRYTGSGAAGRDLLDHIRSLEKPLFKEHITMVENLIKNDRVGGEEMASLIRLYADQLLYTKSQPPEISSNIKAVLLRTKDKHVGRAATLTLSQLGPIEDLGTLFKYAKANDFISDDDYYGEIGNNFMRADAATQDAWLEELSAANNLYSRQVLAFDIASRGMPLEGISPQTALRLLVFFKNNETRFSPTPGVLEVSSSSDYASWLKASARLAAVAFNVDPVKYIEAVLVDKSIDTRKTLSYFIYLSDADTEAFVKTVSPADRRAMANRLIAATFKHPTDATVEDSQRIYARLIADPVSKI